MRLSCWPRPRMVAPKTMLLAQGFKHDTLATLVRAG
jgi:hypothetical protein